MNIFRYIKFLRDLPRTIENLTKSIDSLTDEIIEKTPTIKIMKVNENAKIPMYKSFGDSGMDVRTVEDYNLAPGEFKIFRTGIACSVKNGYEVQVRPRSGLACKQAITVINTPGTVDSNYSGEVGVGLINLSREYKHIEAGDRIAQLVVAKVEHPMIIEVESLEETDRGSKGFGSSGVK